MPEEKEDYCYVDIHRVGPTGTRYKWKRVKLDQIDSLRKKFVDDDSLHIYQTVQQFVEPEHRDGEAHICPLYFDLDADEPEDLHIPLSDAKQLWQFFQMGHDIGDDFKVWFSGKRGFHITVGFECFSGAPSPYTTKIMQFMAETISGNLSLKTWDSTVYTKRRMWRMENTKHGGSGLWKIELTPIELNKMKPDEIRELAKNPREG